MPRSFRLALHQSPGRYQAQLRLQRAEHLLRHSPLSVLEVALAVGFGSTQALARAFRARHGLSPSGYRRMNG
ncbi:MAG: helix-turn-helix domain-containing protein [Roseateles sp.]